MAMNARRTLANSLDAESAVAAALTCPHLDPAALRDVVRLIDSPEPLSPAAPALPPPLSLPPRLPPHRRRRFPPPPEIEPDLTPAPTPTARSASSSAATSPRATRLGIRMFGNADARVGAWSLGGAAAPVATAPSAQPVEDHAVGPLSALCGLAALMLLVSVLLQMPLRGSVVGLFMTAAGTVFLGRCSCVAEEEDVIVPINLEENEEDEEEEVEDEEDEEDEVEDSVADIIIEERDGEEEANVAHDDAAIDALSVDPHMRPGARPARSVPRRLFHDDHRHASHPAGFASLYPRSSRWRGLPGRVMPATAMHRGNPLSEGRTSARHRDMPLSGASQSPFRRRNYLFPAAPARRLPSVEMASMTPEEREREHRLRQRDHMIRTGAISGFGRGWHRQGPGDGAYSSTARRLAMMNRDFNEADYDMLLELDAVNRRQRRSVIGARAEDLQNIPSFVFDPKCEVDRANIGRCCICLSDIERGMLLRTLPCGHSFMLECVDRWLSTNASCPACRARVVEPRPAPIPLTAQTFGVLEL